MSNYDDLDDAGKRVVDEVLKRYTHTGYQQIGARFTAEGLGYAYDDEELIFAMNAADSISLMCVIELAGLAGNEGLAQAALAKMGTAATPV